MIAFFFLFFYYTCGYIIYLYLCFVLLLNLVLCMYFEQFVNTMYLWVKKFYFAFFSCVCLLFWNWHNYLLYWWQIYFIFLNLFIYLFFVCSNTNCLKYNIIYKKKNFINQMKKKYIFVCHSFIVHFTLIIIKHIFIFISAIFIWRVVIKKIKFVYFLYLNFQNKEVNNWKWSTWKKENVNLQKIKQEKWIFFFLLQHFLIFRWVRNKLNKIQLTKKNALKTNSKKAVFYLFIEFWKKIAMQKKVDNDNENNVCE